MKGGASYSSPAVADGLVYMGDWANNVYCLDASTGAQTWIYATQSHVNSSPAVSGGMVYVGSWDHHIYAFGDLQTPSGSSSSNISLEQLIVPIAIIIAVVVIVVQF